tara:strand:- start:197 stop:475 length:279 start_codon:yes stop_codon:yes gene_type:complete
MRNYSNIMQKHGKTFFWATWFLEKEVAYLLYAVYAFCRRLDDLVDNKGSKKNLHHVLFPSEAIKKINIMVHLKNSRGLIADAFQDKLLLKNF